MNVNICPALFVINGNFIALIWSSRFTGSHFTRIIGIVAFVEEIVLLIVAVPLTAAIVESCLCACSRGSQVNRVHSISRNFRIRHFHARSGCPVAAFSAVVNVRSCVSFFVVNRSGVVIALSRRQSLNADLVTWIGCAAGLALCNHFIGIRCFCSQTCILISCCCRRSNLHIVAVYVVSGNSGAVGRRIPSQCYRLVCLYRTSQV
ncbi:hypothetical protein D3C73_965800 [compost metagenome]